MVDQRGLLVRLELHLKRGSVVAVLVRALVRALTEQHPAGQGICGHLLHHAQAPLARFHFQNKGTGDHVVACLHCLACLDCLDCLHCRAYLLGGSCSIFFFNRDVLQARL